MSKKEETPFKLACESTIVLKLNITNLTTTTIRTIAEIGAVEFNLKDLAEILIDNEDFVLIWDTLKGARLAAAVRNKKQ